MALFEAITYEIVVLYIVWGGVSNNCRPLFLVIPSLIKTTSRARNWPKFPWIPITWSLLSHSKSNSWFIHLSPKHVLISQCVADCVRRKWHREENEGSSLFWGNPGSLGKWVQNNNSGRWKSDNTTARAQLKWFSASGDWTTRECSMIAGDCWLSRLVGDSM